mgnify:CR=1 FL=1
MKKLLLALSKTAVQNHSAPAQNRLHHIINCRHTVPSGKFELIEGARMYRRNALDRHLPKALIWVPDMPLEKNFVKWERDLASKKVDRERFPLNLSMQIIE